MKRHLFVILLLLPVVIQSCNSGKGALKKGDYYDATIESINRLRTSPEHKRAKQVLTQSYPLTIQYIESNIQNGISSNDPKKWRNAVAGYEKINYLSDQIKTSMGAMKVITEPQTRFKELADAKAKAAEEAYQEGITEMMKNNRNDSKQAYFDFKDANTFQPGYRESIEMMTQAEFNATLRVAYEEINASRINYGSLQPVINSLARQFLSFKPILQKDTVPPQQLLRIIFTGYREDAQAYVSTSGEDLKRDIKVGEKKGADGKTQDIMQTVSAHITYYHKVKNASSQASFTITDASTNAVLQNMNADGNVNWTYDWGTYQGDSRALNSSQLTLCNKREIGPSGQDLFNQSMNNLQNNLKQQLQNFYSSY